MITLRVIVDQLVSPVPGGLGRYTDELTRSLISTAPTDCVVEGIVSATTAENYEAIETALPGLAGLHKMALPRRELTAAWQLGVPTSAGHGLVHAPGLFAPLFRHDRVRDETQVAVTVHDVLAWTHPESLTPTTVARTKLMLKRARKHADAVVVPSHALADQLNDLMDFGDRVRVIGGAVSSGLALPTNSAAAEAIATRLGLPQEYILTAGTLEPRRAVTAVIDALGRPGAADLPLVVLGPDSWGDLTLAQVADEAGLATDRVRSLDGLTDQELAVVMSRASVFVYPSLEEGFGLPIIQAFKFGTPVIHSDAPALVETGGDAGFTVERDDPAGYPERLGAAIDRVLGDTVLADRLRIFGSDRARAFTWRETAERVWQLHADL